MIAVLDYGIGNLHSAEKALRHAGADARLVTEADRVKGASGVVLPGVGAFGRCMEALRASGLDRAAKDAVDGGTPFLGICIGMQMLYEGSEEDPDATGLGLLSGMVRRLPDGVRLPQMQWNRLEFTRPESRLWEGLAGAGPGGVEPWVYFVHSYAPEPSADVIATCDYGGAVVAAVERERVWATQFHPEKSGAVGLRILANFARICGDAADGG